MFGVAGDTFGVAICAEAGYDKPFDDAAAGGARLMLFPAAPGLYGPRRADEASWRRGFSWWEGSSLGDAARHARRCGLWIAQAGQVTARLPDWHPGTLVVDIPLPPRTP